MISQESVILTLQNAIKGALIPLINEQVILLDCPYHINIGDTLIWQGELDFLKSINKYPIAQHSKDTFEFSLLEKEIIICLHGGGNFGDLYRGAQEFRKEVISCYPNNRIVMFPQTVWYEDKSLIEEDCKVFSKHKDLHLCARDMVSYEMLKRYFPNNSVLLVPDMAFYIDKKLLGNQNKYSTGNSSVYIKRLDKELDDSKRIDLYKIDEIRDWPGFEKYPLRFRVVDQFLKILRRCPKSRGVIGKIIDKYMINIVRRRQIQNGVSFLSKYQTIYTTRLHAMILGLLLNKDIKAIDNKSHKLSSFIGTWLQNEENIELIN